MFPSYCNVCILRYLCLMYLQSQVSKNMLLNDIERRIQDSNASRIQIPEGKNIPEHFDSDFFSKSKNDKNHNRIFLMCAVYVFRNFEMFI